MQPKLQFSFLADEEAEGDSRINNRETIDDGPASGPIAEPHSSAKDGAPRAVQKKVSRGSTRGFHLVVTLTISVFICWTPVMAYYTYYVLTGIDYPEIDFATSILFSLQAVFDPLLVFLMLNDLRNTIMNEVFCRSSTR